MGIGDVGSGTVPPVDPPFPGKRGESGVNGVKARLPGLGELARGGKLRARLKLPAHDLGAKPCEDTLVIGLPPSRGKICGRFHWVQSLAEG